MQRDYVKIAFKNGSYLDIVAARETTRGGRRTSGLVEESILVDGKILNEVIIPQRFLGGLYTQVYNANRVNRLIIGCA